MLKTRLAVTNKYECIMSGWISIPENSNRLLSYFRRCQFITIIQTQIMAIQNLEKSKKYAYY